MENAEENNLEDERINMHEDVEDDFVDPDYLDEDWE